MPAEAGHILYKDSVDCLILHLFFDFTDAVAVKGHTADVVVEGLSDDLIALFVRELSDDFSLIVQRIHLVIVVAGEPCV